VAEKAQSFELETGHGTAVGIKAEAGHPWRVEHPWGMFRHYGTKSEAMERMKRIIAERMEI